MNKYNIQFRNPYIAQHNAVAHIKEIRSIFSLELKEAKDFYDKMRERPFDTHVFESPCNYSISYTSLLKIVPVQQPTQETKKDNLKAAILAAIDTALTTEEFETAISLIRVLKDQQ